MPADDKTRILLSFAMASHGANFANWLRDRLMKEYKFYNVRAVYVDSVVARSGETVHGSDIPSNVPSGVAAVKLDTRSHMASETGARPIGAMRSDWNEMYRTAMEEADVMLFVFTGEYGDSVWCMKEWGQFHKENGRRMGKGKTLRGIFLEFTDGSNLLGINQTNITRLAVNKTDGQCRGLAWDKGDFILNDTDMKKLTSAIGSLS
jgi:hypothetical protein